MSAPGRSKLVDQSRGRRPMLDRADVVHICDRSAPEDHIGKIMGKLPPTLDTVGAERRSG
jgi:hypothetical protein